MLYLPIDRTTEVLVIILVVKKSFLETLYNKKIKFSFKHQDLIYIYIKLKKKTTFDSLFIWAILSTSKKVWYTKNLLCFVDETIKLPSFVIIYFLFTLLLKSSHQLLTCWKIITNFIAPMIAKTCNNNFRH